MEFLESLFGIIGDLTWGWSLIPILVILGLFITALTGFVQFRFFGRMFRVLDVGDRPCRHGDQPGRMFAGAAFQAA